MSKKENIVEIKNNEELNDIEVPEIQGIPGDDNKEGDKDMKEKENETKKTEKKEVFFLLKPFVAVGNGAKKVWGWAKKNPGKAIVITNAITGVTVYGINAASQKKRDATHMPIETNFVDKPEVPSIEDIQVPEIPPIPDIPEIPTDIPVTE